MRFHSNEDPEATEVHNLASLSESQICSHEGVDDQAVYHKEELILEGRKTGNFWDEWNQLNVDGMNLWEVANGCEKRDI